MSASRKPLPLKLKIQISWGFKENLTQGSGDVIPLGTGSQQASSIYTSTSKDTLTRILHPHIDAMVADFDNPL